MAPDSGPEIGFFGGAGTVTGSRHLLSSGGKRVLIDCGLFQGLKQLRLLNWKAPPFDPPSIDAVVLTHTHIDHSGYLPRLVAESFGGRISCSPPTADLAPVLLMDAAKLQEEDAAYANRKGFSKHDPARPLFTSADVRRTLEHLAPAPDGQAIEVADGITLRLHGAGHILGSAFAEVEVAHADRTLRVVFSGDIGRYGVPLHPDPKPLPACDALVIESTYGDRLHDRTPIADQLCPAACQTLERGGIVLIPAFAMARVQLLTVILRRAMEHGELPAVPVHIDSPMAVEITGIYRRYAGSDVLDADISAAEWRRLLPGGRGSGRESEPALAAKMAGASRARHGGAQAGSSIGDEEWRSLFPPDVRFHRTVDESKELNALAGRRIIIASSGMLTGGRVVHHLRRLLPDRRNLIALAGYQAPGTRGRALQEGARTLRMHGIDVPVGARTITLHGLSSHADADDLMKWLQSGPALPKAVFVTHGEPRSASALASRIRKEARLQAIVPALGDRVALDQVLAGGAAIRPGGDEAVR